MPKLPARRPLRPALVATLALALAAGAAHADAIDDYLRREMAIRKIPGLGIAVARDGKVVRTASYGVAHVETGSPVTDDSIFAIASLDKQITATGLLKAAELGKLGLDDPVSKWVEVELPGATLRQLVAHLSGLPDVVAGSFEGRSFTDYTSEQLLATVAGLVPIAPPGARFSYSDAGLFLAQLATEKAVGEPWWAFMRREVFGPAGMKSPVSMAPGLLLPHRVSAYTLDGEGALVRDRRLDVDYGPLYNDLGMTAADFARFLAAQDGTTPLSAASIATLTTPMKTSDGAFSGELFQWSRYGLGVGLDDFLGEPVTLHSGHSGVGYVRFPRRHLSIAVLTNLEHAAGSDPVGLAIGIAGLLEPALAIANLPPAATGDTTRVARLRADYEALLAGKPDLERYATRYRTIAWEGAASLAGRSKRLGALATFELLREGALDGERSLLFRARHAHGDVYLRLSLDGDAKISRAVWWHV